MKKISTVAVKTEEEYFSAETDHRTGSGRSQQLVLRVGRSRPDTAGAASPHDCESLAGSLRCDAAQPDRAGNRDAFALDQPLAQRVGTRSDRGQCAQGAADRGEPQERRSPGCADAGAAGQDRSRVAVSGEASQRAGASRSDDDSGACRLVRARTGLVNTARGLAKSYGERLRGCNVRNMNPEKAEGLSPELQAALEPLLGQSNR